VTRREETPVNSGIHTVIYPVKDLAKSKALYGTLLGIEPYADEPYYVGFRLEDQEFGLDPNGHDKGMTGPVGYYHVDDIKGTLGRLLDGGATQQGEIRDVGGGRLIVTLTDPDGNVFGLLQDL
jgi:predicted enzyme related to lactoylglutathione lyase